jgi:hypothetical protein
LRFTPPCLKQGIDLADIQAIREGQLPRQKRYAALSGLGKKLIEKRGQLTGDDVTAFLEAGFEKEHAGRVFRSPNSKSRIFYL